MSKITKKVKVLNMRLDGFHGDKARWWLNSMQYDKNNNAAYTDSSKEWAYNNGFLPEFVERYEINEENKDNYISLHDYAFIYPVNDIFRKWVVDRVTTRNVLKPYKEYLPKQYFHIYSRDREPMIIKLLDCPEKYSDDFDGILELIRDMGKVSLYKTSGLYSDTIEYKDGQYYFNGTLFEEERVVNRLRKRLKRGIRVLTEYVEADGISDNGTDSPNLLRVIFYNKYADNPKIGQAYLRVNTEATELAGLNIVEEQEDDAPDADFVERVEETNYTEEYDNTSAEKMYVENTESDDENDDEDLAYAEIYEKNMVEDQIVLPKRGKKARIVKYAYLPIDLETGKYETAKWVNDSNKIESRVICDVEGKEIKGEIPGWADLCKLIEKLGKFIPQIELMAMDIMFTADGIKFIDFVDHPSYPQAVGFNKEMTDYFKMKVAQAYEQSQDPEFRKKNKEKKMDSVLWTRLTRLLCPPNMRPLIYKWWYVTVKADLLSNNGISLPKKIWAYRKGFLSYRIPQYGITKENYQNFISDYDYRYLRHINNKYRVWLEDKITVKYICSDYSQFFPKYYYHVSVRNGEKRIIPLMDLPDYCDENLESIFTLVQRVGELACKPQRGSQGQGFYKLSYHDGKYFLNHEEAQKEDILDILGNPDSQYLITEYIKQHPVIDNIYSGAVNTLRIITFAKDGKNPQIGNAYMRFGSKKTGAVDNMGAGGMFVQVDMETGRFFNGKIITENSIVPCKNHPDTNALLEGYLPNWDVVKQGVLDLCKAMPQLEYLGFDVAISEDGMKLPEINRAPGYPKIETFQRPTIDYLLYKKDVKMAKNNIQKTKW